VPGTGCAEYAQPEPGTDLRSRARRAILDPVSTRTFSRIALGGALLACTAFALQQSHLPADTLRPDFGVHVPRGLVAQGTPDTPPKPEVLALGRALFFDPILSADRSVA